VAKIAGLIRRGSTYSLRRRVPSDLVKALGRREVWVALGTTDYKTAAKAARMASVRLDVLWQNQRDALARGEKITPADTVSEAELRRAVVGTFWAGEQSVQPVSPDAALRESIEADIGDFSSREDPSAEAALLSQARKLVEERKLNIPLPGKTQIGKEAEAFTASPELLRLLELLRRADIEHLKRTLDRMSGQHGDMAHDPLFAGVNSVSPLPAMSEGVTLGDAIKRFETDPTRANLGKKSAEKYFVPFRALKETIGEDRPLASVTRAQCAEVQEVLAGLPVNFPKIKPYKGLKTLREIATLAAERGDRGLSAGGVRVHTHALSSFFNWGIKKGLLVHNPATRMAPARGPAEVSRRPFNIAELNKIVEWLRDWSGNQRRPSRYWVPLIAIFSGMRLGEIVTLTTDDVGMRDGVECFILRRTEDRSLKTAGSERIVPVHPELVKLGFLKRVATVRDEGGSRLFPDLEGATQGEVSSHFQKNFAYWQKKGLGITERGVSFHSFRHGFRDALREAGVPIDATRALGGWARSGGIEETYGQGTRPSTLAKWMEKVAYEGLDLAPLEAG